MTGRELEALAGSWRLISVSATFPDTGEQRATFGDNPTGRMVMTPSGRIMFLITKSHRHPPVDDAAKGALFNETIAYSGTVRLDGPGAFVTTVEMSLFPEEVGTEKRRLFTLDGDRLIITRPEQTSRMTKGRPMISTLIWTRERPAA